MDRGGVGPMPFRASLISAWSCQEYVIFIVYLFLSFNFKFWEIFLSFSIWKFYQDSHNFKFCFGSRLLLTQLPQD